MSKAKPGGYAFPFTTVDGFVWEGMTLRDYFAAQAITGTVNIPGGGVYKDVAESAYRMADLMLEAREKDDEHD